MLRYPKVGDVFADPDEFHECLNTLAENNGFRVRCRQSSVVKRTAIVNYKVYECHCFGRKRGKRSIKCGCPWQVCISFTQSTRLWKVTRVDTRHMGHEMISNAEMVAKSNQIPANVQDLILSYNQGGVKVSSMGVVIKCLQPDINCTWGNKAVHNFLTKFGKRIPCSAQAMLLKGILDTRKQFDTELRY